MTAIWFLEAPLPLTKRFTLRDEQIEKHPYPLVSEFTSHEVQITTPKELYAAVKAQAKLGHCLIKGRLHSKLDHESRAGATRTNDETSWLCLDLDRAPYKTPQEFMASIPALSAVSYVVQYSASSGLPKAKGLSCHIFVLLDAPMHAPYIKAWLMELNMTHDKLRPAITLTKSNADLHWPVDITACQNDKLLYIAPPIISQGVRYSIKSEELIQLVAGKTANLAISTLKHQPIDALKKEKVALVTSLRAAAKLPAIKSALKIVGEHEIQPKPGVATITGIKEDRGFRYFNFNGGDSWGYYQPVDNIELIHNFKGEPSYYTKDIAPEFYKEAVGARKRDSKRPTEAGEIIKAFCERRSAKYYKMIWNPATLDLQLFPAKSELQLEHFLNSYGKGLNGEFIEQWDMYFNPQTETIVDIDAKTINTYIPSRFYRAYQPRTKHTIPPLIRKILLHAVSAGKENAVLEHFLNWLACIFQHRIKTTTAWVLSGTYGTGKNLLISSILAPLLGRQYVQEKRNRELEEKFNGWIESALIAFIDEAQVSASAAHEVITADLKNLITELHVSIRRMNIDSYMIPNYTNFIFSSNKRDPVVLDAKDRRFNFGDYQDTPLQVTRTQIAEDLPAELELFFDYMMTRKADVNLAATIIHNETRMNVVRANLTSVDMLADALCTGNIECLWDSMPDMKLIMELRGAGSAQAATYADIVKKEMHLLMSQGEVFGTQRRLPSKLTRDQLNVIFEYCIGNTPMTPNKFTRFLAHHNINTKRIRLRDNTLAFGIDIEWKASNTWLEERKEAFTPTAKPLRVVK